MADTKGTDEIDNDWQEGRRVGTVGLSSSPYLIYILKCSFTDLSAAGFDAS